MTGSLTQVGTTELLPAPQAGTAEAALELYQSAEIGKGLEFFDRFGSTDGAQTALTVEAERILPEVLGSTQFVIDYGMDALQDVIGTTRKIMKLTEDVKLPGDEDAALRDLKVQLDKAGGYDLTIAENLKRYRAMKEKLGSMFGKKKAQTYFAAFKADRQSLEALTDEMSGDFAKQAMHRALMANATQELHETNLDSLLLLEERIAVLEKVREQVRARRTSMPDVIAVDDPQADEARTLEMLDRMLDLKITDLASRWYTGVALNPMLRAQHEQQVMMTLKLNTMATTGMEKVRLILAQYAMTLDLQKDADTTNAFNAFDNDMTQTMFKQTRATIGAVAKATTESSMSTETISVIAQEVTGMITDVQSAYAAAKQGNQEKMTAIQSASKVIDAAQRSDVKALESAVSTAGSVVSQGRKTKSITGA